jgi:ATP-binding cassette subfamily C (CFTR/MRP) protein 4
MSDWYLAYWTGLEPAKRNSELPRGTYSGIVFAFLIVALVRSQAFVRVCLSASQVLHDRALHAVLAVPMRFFDTQPLGRIVNRFSSDLAFIDTLLPAQFFDCTQMVLWVLGIVFFVASLNPWIFLFLAPLVVAFVLLRRWYMVGARAVKRLENVARSPCYSHLIMTVTGLATVRSHAGAVERLTADFEQHQDRHSRAYFAFVAVGRWLG